MKTATYVNNGKRAAAREALQNPRPQSLGDGANPFLQSFGSQHTSSPFTKYAHATNRFGDNAPSTQNMFSESDLFKATNVYQ